MSKVIETDSRGRISLKKLGVDGRSHYQASVLAGGNILLEPVTFKTALEASVESVLPAIDQTIAQNHDSGYPVATAGKTVLADLLSEHDS